MRQVLSTDFSESFEAKMLQLLSPNSPLHRLRQDIEQGKDVSESIALKIVDEILSAIIDPATFRKVTVRYQRGMGKLNELAQDAQMKQKL